MVHGVGVQTLHETEVVDDLGRVRHEIAHPGAALAVLVKRFDRRQHQLAERVAGHRAKAFALDQGVGRRRPMPLDERRLVVESVDVRRPAVLKQVDDALGPRSEVGPARWPCRLAFRRGAVAGQQGGQGGGADAAGRSAEEFAAIEPQLTLQQRRRGGWIEDAIGHDLFF